MRPSQAREPQSQFLPLACWDSFFKGIEKERSNASKLRPVRPATATALYRSLEVDAAEIRMRAVRRLGEMLAEQKAQGGLSKGMAGAGVNQYTPAEVRSSQTTAPKLSDAGISYDLDVFLRPVPTRRSRCRWPFVF